MEVTYGAPNMVSGTSIPELTEDVLGLILACGTCMDSARAACVCTRWRSAAVSSPVWRRHLVQEFGVEMVPQLVTPYRFFHLCLRSSLTPVLSDIQRFSSCLAAIRPPPSLGVWPPTGGWQLRYAVGHHNDGRLLPSKLYPDQVTTNPQSVWKRYPDQVTTNPQSVWIEFDLHYRMIIRGCHLQLVACAPPARDDHALGVQPCSQGSGMQPCNTGSAEEQCLVVIDIPEFKMPVTEQARLLQSHIDGIYAWIEEDATPRLVAYVHMEQLLPLALGQLEAPQVLHGRWGCMRPQSTSPVDSPATSTALTDSQCQQAGAGPGAGGSSSTMPPAGFLPPSCPVQTCAAAVEPTLRPMPHSAALPYLVSQAAASPLAAASCHPQPSHPDPPPSPRLAATHNHPRYPHSDAIPSPSLAMMLHLDLCQLHAPSSQKESFVILLQATAESLQGQGMVVFQGSAIQENWAHVAGPGPDARLEACISVAAACHGLSDPLIPALWARGPGGTTAFMPGQHGDTMHGQPVTIADATRGQPVAMGATHSHPTATCAMRGQHVAVSLRAALEREGMLDLALYPVGWVTPYQSSAGLGLGLSMEAMEGTEPVEAPTGQVGGTNGAWHAARGASETGASGTRGPAMDIDQSVAEQQSATTRSGTAPDSGAGPSSRSEGPHLPSTRGQPGVSRGRQEAHDRAHGGTWPRDPGAGRLLLGRCGVEVWVEQPKALPLDARHHWQTFMRGVAHGGNARGQLGAGGAAGDGLVPAAPAPMSNRLFAPLVANFLVDGVEQHLWENSLEFWFVDEPQEGPQSLAIQQGPQGTAAPASVRGPQPLSHWGLARLSLTRQSACKLWGMPYSGGAAPDTEQHNA